MAQTKVTDDLIDDVAASKLTGALPAISGASLTNLDARDLENALPAISGASLTSLNASNLGSGTVPTARLGSGTASSSTFLRGDSTYAAAGGGKVLQTIWTNTSTVTSTNTAFGWDDTIPQISEGTEILTQAFTPVSATSNILIQAKINYGLSVNARAVGALFVSTSTNALTMSYSAEGNTEMEHINLQWYVASGSTSARTYSARVGTSGTSYYIRVNTGGETTHRFSTANNSNMLITEYEAN